MSITPYATAEKATLPKIRAPFPWFGGKKRACEEVWRRFGPVKNYIEPFAGSAAMLLGRPGGASGVETINDADGFVSNFWRAMVHAPEGVARWADWPVNEADLHARHLWLVGKRESLTDRLMADPDFFDEKVAGWWCWGASACIAGGWCSGKGPWVAVGGVLTKAPGHQGPGIVRGLPRLGDSGNGIHRISADHGGIHAGVWPFLEAVAGRMRRVRVACGDWRRVIGPSVMRVRRPCAVFLDPPYGEGALDYAVDDKSIAARVAEWAWANGDNPGLRIALCGYGGQHEPPDGWTVYAWKTKGGFSSIGGDNKNQKRERIWFSPHCEPVESAAMELLS